jgi:hypothetical protein
VVDLDADHRTCGDAIRRPKYSHETFNYKIVTSPVRIRALSMLELSLPAAAGIGVISQTTALKDYSTAVLPCHPSLFPITLNQLRELPFHRAAMKCIPSKPCRSTSTQVIHPSASTREHPLPSRKELRIFKFDEELAHEQHRWQPRALSGVLTSVPTLYVHRCTTYAHTNQHVRNVRNTMLFI